MFTKYSFVNKMQQKSLKITDCTIYASNVLIMIFYYSYVILNILNYYIFRIYLRD